MGKVIFIPTDFSINAWVAIQYAANLAIESNCKLIIIHAFKEGEKAIKEQMSGLLKQLVTEFPEIDYLTIYKKGNLNEVISQIARKYPPKLIVMGTKGASGLKYVIVGSNTLNVVNHFNIPVLAVPKSNNFYSINKIGILSNYKNFEIDVMRKSIAVLPAISNLTLLHVRENENEDEETIIGSWKELMKVKTGLKNIDHKIGIGSSILSVVNNMLEEEQIDLLIITNNGKRFFKSLFNRDLLKAIALKPHISILFVKP